MFENRQYWIRNKTIVFFIEKLTGTLLFVRVITAVVVMVTQPLPPDALLILTPYFRF